MLPEGHPPEAGAPAGQGAEHPVLIITAREEEKDKILGLDLGADDYITKAFSTSVSLWARVKANIRRVVMVSQARPEPKGTC